MTQVVSLALRRHLTRLADLPPGWRAHYRQLAETLACTYPSVQITHAGAKAAMLQVILGPCPAEAQALAIEARFASAEICEECGAPARILVDRSGYYRTLCPRHDRGFHVPPSRRR